MREPRCLAAPRILILPFIGRTAGAVMAANMKGEPLPLLGAVKSRATEMREDLLHYGLLVMS